MLWNEIAMSYRIK